ncbi:MAG: NAD(P)-binding domain-containing protein, partial [Gemmatimonadota bacterium]
MKIGIIGSGIVGQTLGAKLVERGHDVALGTRSPADLSEARGSGYLNDWFGWKPESLVDLGGIEASRGTEMLLPLWI